MATEPIPPGRFYSVHLRFSRGVITIAAIVLILAVGISFGVYQLLKRAPKPLAVPEAHCVVRTPGGDREMDIEQARIAATIAAVAARRKLPERAVVIAYATALQESKLYNLDYGDRDSVGVFQQRESQGWGTKKQIMDPVYATERFFAALVKVKGYRKMPVAEAAQEVQRSAAGYAYGPHQEEAEILAAAFTGRVPRAVHCWYPPETGQAGDAQASGGKAGAEQAAAPRPKTAQARRQLKRALGSTTVTGSKRGWLIAAWSVAHAQRYGLSRVEYAGARWSNDTRVEGWVDGSASGSRKVELA
ncbi:hypothetical protein [Nonomuraea sp. C10]|uniref:hypothetical protein n=1 Tax=Nonomuraea sp. C10 TaxID=2600577 RepID=UPI0021C2D004|nr:hypothetical protein [Nonomuraea sp. C10]